MGSFTIRKWQCDRCGDIFDDRPKVSRAPKIDAASGDGRAVQWYELCSPCTDRVHTLIVELAKEQADLDEKVDAHG